MDLGGLLIGADACIANYVFRVILVSIPLVILLASFARFIQVEKERRQSNDLLGKDFLMTVLFVFFAVMGVRLIYTTWEFFGVPVNCMFYSLGLYQPDSSSLASTCNLSSDPNITNFIPTLNPSQLGINVCSIPKGMPSSGSTMPFIPYLAFSLEIIVTITRLSFFAFPILVSSVVILKPLVSMFEEIREKQESHHIVLLKVMATALLVIPAIMVVVNYIYIMLYIDYAAILKWAQNTFLNPTWISNPYS